MRILILSPYPLSNPNHGGKIRVNEIVKLYKSLGHKVEIGGINSSESYHLEKGFVRYPGHAQLSKIAPDYLGFEDLYTGQFAFEDAQTRRSLYRKLAGEYDAMQLEQPWLLDFALWFGEQLPKRPRLIYSSHNIEHVVAAAKNSQFSLDRSKCKQIEYVKELEIRAITISDATIAVSESDAEWQRAQGAPRVIVARNGVQNWLKEEEDVQFALGLTGNSKFALFIGSAHPPNVEGLLNVFNKGLGSLGPSEKLVIAGEVGNSLKQHPKFLSSPNLAKRSIITGSITRGELLGLIAMSHVIILPILSGGGTNLKTAEALLSNKHILATKLAFRGFEEFEKAKGVRLIDSIDDFNRELRRVMDEGSLELEESEIILRRQLSWDQTLIPLRRVI